MPTCHQRVLFVCFMVCVAHLNGCDSQKETDGKITIDHPVKFLQEERRPGTWQETLKGAGENGSDLRFTIQVPENYDGVTPVPLVFTLHFGGEVTPFYGRGILTGLTQPALADLGAIIVAPDSVGGPWSSPKNESAVLAIFNFVMEKYAIEKGKTLLTGFSMGGHGTFHLAALHQDKFAAAIPLAGTPTEQARTADWTIPLYVIHSRADKVVPIGPTSAFVDKQRAAQVGIEFIALDDLEHFDVAAYVEHLKAAVPWVLKAWN